MNAPTPAAAVATAANARQFRLVALDAIVPSKNEIQRMRRERFDKDALNQLAASVRQVGVAEPILLRTLKGNDKLEIIAGERRWLAARIAGVAEIPAMVGTFTDDEALELQLIENLQRVDLHEMEEAEGYAALRHLKKLTPEQIAEQVGKSRSQVYARLKLLDLCPEARKAFYAGQVTASIALLIARIGHHDTQRAALKDLTGKGEFYFDGDTPTYKEALEHIQEEYIADLKTVAFKLDDAMLLPKAGPCTTCLKRTGNQKDLFTDIKNPNACSDPKCLADKQAAHVVRVKKELEAKGESVISGDEAKKIFPSKGSMHVAGGYVEPDSQDYIAGKYRSFQAALGKDMPAVQLVEHPTLGKLVPVVKKADIDKALKAKFKDTSTRSSFGSSGNAQQSANERKARIATTINMRILRAIRQANRLRAFDAADTALVVSRYFRRADYDSEKRIVDDRLDEAGHERPKGHGYVGDWAEKIVALSPIEQAGLLIDLALINECHVASYNLGHKPELLHATAKRLKIDPDKIRKDVQAEFDAKKKPAKKGAKK